MILVQPQAGERKSAATIAKPVVKQSAKVPVKAQINETRTSVSTGLIPKPLSKHSADTVDIEEESASYQDAADADAVMQDGGEASDGEPTLLTFGDLVRGNSTVDIQQRPSAPISATSLGTILNQALRTDDADLLESCLQTTNVKVIENTINRIDSSLAGILLSKLSARMHRRPGRAFGLMRALVSQLDLVARLGELSRVLEERSRGLSSLLALKGKLDILYTQMKYRKSIKAAGSSQSRLGEEEESSKEEEEDADEPRIVYVEGQESLGKGALTNRTAAGGVVDDDNDFPAGTAVISDSEEESEEEFKGDIEEELADAESLDKDKVDYDDVEEDEEEEESEDKEAQPPAKVRRTSAKISKRK
ncbi:hypothetical protein MYCTH_97961 [Thermothelomyces thermophilus ATCC 42464]|uniref:Small-subunit processome Utp12 domain-containing protein n=1 Tax=Thermothelomyces thermophilus (strain ATCC 42464 / BCRC 31852 / DSM 1799) TaxID=573729 RepID=G2QM38_THET4|nr:uncharacterized protein MYCTH_97961 [Thermothelomyces thermophilus ATCC 42464]AEO61018.1 hypothetical protein MYCTH_97961 [Thermothelomyces thermophilus ATCC 42464]